MLRTPVIAGPVLDVDGTASTDRVVGDFKISKNGGSPAALNGSATLTHRATVINVPAMNNCNANINPAWARGSFSFRAN